MANRNPLQREGHLHKHVYYHRTLSHGGFDNTLNDIVKTDKIQVNNFLCRNGAPCIGWKTPLNAFKKNQFYMVYGYKMTLDAWLSEQINKGDYYHISQRPLVIRFKLHYAAS